MSDAQSAAAAFAAPVPFAGAAWPRLLMPEYGTLEEAVRQVKMARLTLLLDRCAVVGADRFVFLRDALIHDILPADVQLYLNTKAGAQKALEISAALAGKSVEDTQRLVNALPFVEASKLAMVLSGFADLVGQDDGADPLPSGGTGEPTPGSSASAD